MHSKVIKLILLTLFLGTITGNFPAKALESTDCTNEQYLLKHGHSPELVRMINLSKERTQGDFTEPVQNKSQNKFIKVLKNLWYEEDVTLPIKDFGYNDIQTVETGKNIVPKIIDTKNTVIDAVHKTSDFVKNDKNKEIDPNEVNINDIKVRESK